MDPIDNDGKAARLPSYLRSGALPFRHREARPKSSMVFRSSIVENFGYTSAQCMGFHELRLWGGGITVRT
jgi:hypothetical protein